MTKQDPIQSNIKLRVLLDQYQRHIKKLELRMREDKRTLVRLEHENYSLRQKMQERDRGE